MVPFPLAYAVYGARLQWLRCGCLPSQCTRTCTCLAVDGTLTTAVLLRPVCLGCALLPNLMHREPYAAVHQLLPCSPG